MDMRAFKLGQWATKLGVHTHLHYAVPFQSIQIGKPTLCESCLCSGLSPISVQAISVKIASTLTRIMILVSPYNVR